MAEQILGVGIRKRDAQHLPQFLKRHRFVLAAEFQIEQVLDFVRHWKESQKDTRRCFLLAQCGREHLSAQPKFLAQNSPERLEGFALQQQRRFDLLACHGVGADQNFPERLAVLF